MKCGNNYDANVVCLFIGAAVAYVRWLYGTFAGCIGLLLLHSSIIVMILELIACTRTTSIHD